MKVKNKILSASTFATISFFACQSTADQVFNDEVIIVASLCVGVDCVNGESFNFDTIRLKENNLRIKFQDTSSSSSFPSVDWQLTANDSINGGQNYFAIENVDTTQVPFKVASGARTNALYIADNDFVGLGTSTPSVNLHLKSGNSPALRLEQDGSSGFSAQTWDVAGNETNFFVRDVTNGSNIPFKIQPQAPKNSLFVASDGDIGFKTPSPDGLFDIAHPADANDHAVLVSSTGNFGVNVENGFSPNGLLDVQTAGGASSFIVKNDGKVGIGTSNVNTTLNIAGNSLPTSQNEGCGPIDCIRYTGVVVIEDTDASPAGRSLLTLKNNGPSWLVFENNEDRWNFTNGGNNFTLAYYDSDSDSLSSLLSIDKAGNLSVPGTVNGGSNLASKTKIAEVNYTNILEKLMTLSISSWQYKNDDHATKHIGPISQDFFGKFGIGTDEEHISPMDTSGVALASIKALVMELRKSQNELLEIKEKVAKLENK